MTETARCRVALAGCLFLAAAVFLPGINWGLPSRRVDPYLFGDRPAWTGRQIQELTRAAGGAWDDPARGADVDADPLGKGNGPVVVNTTDADRAEIVRRYRLFTYQPDEMITLMSLARMHPGRGDFDPKLYQYGGLWIYPVGAGLRAAAACGLIDLRGGTDGLTFYLDHPEAFGRFYVVARGYVVLWALVGVGAVFHLVRRILGGVLYPALAAAGFALLPVVVNMAHEAKPHLPGAVLVLLAVLAAARFVETGTRRAALAAGAACGAAFGMVLSALPAFALLPVMTLLRRMPWAERARVVALSGLVGGLVYAATNPYVVLNQFTARGRAVMKSNVGNSTAMYRVGRPLAGVWNEALLAAEGTSPVLAAAGLLGAAALGVRAIRTRKDASPPAARRRAAGVLLAVPAACIAGQFALIGAGKPGEFGRFLLVPDVFLLIEAVVAVATFVCPAGARVGLLAVLLGSTAAAGGLYLRGFVRDSREVTPRLAEAERLRQFRSRGAATLAVAAEPAPYALPPVDLFGWRIVKPPPGGDPNDIRPPADVTIRAVDAPPGGGAWDALTATRISWAAKPFEVTSGAAVMPDGGK